MDLILWVAGAVIWFIAVGLHYWFTISSMPDDDFMFDYDNMPMLLQLLYLPFTVFISALIPIYQFIRSLGR